MDINQILIIIPRSIISLIILFLITKLIGKKQVSELSLFDYVIGISIGNFTAEMTLDIEGQYINGAVAMLTFGLFAFFVSWAAIKSIWFRRLIIGVPTIIIENGKILEEAMRKVKININDLLEQARNAGYFDISQIAFAIMEANGKISFLVKDLYNQPTKKDLKMKSSPDNLTANIIIDGKLMEKNIQNTDKTKDWFIKQLKIKGYETYEDILLGTYLNQTLTIYPKKIEIKAKDVLE